MSKLSSFDEGYLRLTLEIDKHVPGYIDAYIGPADLKESVATKPPQRPADLLAQVARLRDAVPTYDRRRADYLYALLRAMETSVRLIGGEAFDYLTEVRLLYDIEPRLVEEREFVAAHSTLDRSLPGSGDLQRRMEGFRRQFEVDDDSLLSLLGLARAETRRRTVEVIDLVPGEDLEIRLVSEKPWGAYNWYRGGAKSLVEFNIDVPTSAPSIVSTMAHEGYPGHHTEHQLKERLLWIEKGYAEHASYVLHSPAAVISEAIATTAVEIAFPEDKHHEWNVEVLMPAAGLEPWPVETLRAARSARKMLQYVSTNAAILFHSGELNQTQTVDYLQTYGLLSKERSAKSFEFLTNPLFRSYVFTYTMGYDLIDSAVAGQDKLPLFKRLLTEQILPSAIAEMPHAIPESDQ